MFERRKKERKKGGVGDSICGAVTSMLQGYVLQKIEAWPFRVCDFETDWWAGIYWNGVRRYVQCDRACSLFFYFCYTLFFCECERFGSPSFTMLFPLRGSTFFDICACCRHSAFVPIISFLCFLWWFLLRSDFLQSRTLPIFCNHKIAASLSWLHV